MPTVRSTWDLAASVALASRLWTDTEHWPAFIDGFGHVVEVDPDWPEPGSTVVWQSTPAGRGRVTERIVERDDDHVVTDVEEEQLRGRQSLYFEPGTVTMELDYTLTTGGPLRALTDVLFIRRALAMALDRTLQAFSAEAAQETTL